MQAYFRVKWRLLYLKQSFYLALYELGTFTRHVKLYMQCLDAFLQQ